MSGALELEKEIKAQLENIEPYRKTSEDRAAKDAFVERLSALKEFRKSSGIEDVWRAADKAYVPHKLDAKSGGRKVLASDDELGWRSTPVILESEDNWQEDSVPPNPYIKIQTALGIIVDGNPTAVMSPAQKRFEANTVLMENLYGHTWDIAKSKAVALKPFVFNCAKYGIGIGRTFPYNITKQVKEIVKFDPVNKKNCEFKDVRQTYYNDVFRESLNPWTVWLDDNAKVGDPFSCNDVIYYKDYNWKKLKDNFGHLGNFKYIKPQKKVLLPDGKLEVYHDGLKDQGVPKYQERVWFWESFELDMLFVMTDDEVVLVNVPLPQQPENKKLSIWYAPWTMRDDSSPYGIGVYESMRNDHKLYTKVRAMTMDQLVLSIYKEWFYSGTDTIDGDGLMKIRPGRGRRVNDPKNMKWSDVPSPGNDAWNGLAFIEDKIDQATAISKNLEGQITGKTAFEISQARESSMKRLKTPLENITDALEIDAAITLGIIEDLYSVPKIKSLVDESYIEDAQLQEQTRENGYPLIEGEDFVYEYREVPMNVQRNDDGAIVKSDQRQFFILKPEDLPWDGVIKIDGQSLVASSEILDRVTTVEMANIVVPLFTAPPEIAMKPATEIVKAYKKDPKDWLPDAWINPQPPAVPAAPQLFVDPSNPAPEETAGGGNGAVKPGLKTVNGGQGGTPLTPGGSNAAAIMEALKMPQ